MNGQEDWLKIININPIKIQWLKRVKNKSLNESKFDVESGRSGTTFFARSSISTGETISTPIFEKFRKFQVLFNSL